MTPILPEFILFAINTLGCGLTCWYSLTGINACTRKTALAARISFGTLAIGSFALLLHPPDLDVAGMASSAIAAGVGVGFFANRRKCVCLNCPMRPGPRHPAPIEWAEIAQPERRAVERDDGGGLRA